MSRAKLLVKGILLMSGIGIVAAGSALAAAQPSIGDPNPTTVVIRGSTPVAAQSATGADISPAILRGSPPSAERPPSAEYTCASGYDYDPSYGCVVPGYASEPNEYGYWPYYGFGGFSFGHRRHGVNRAFVHGMRRGFAPRSGRLANGFGHSSTHGGAIGHR
jgi:hypothetical protein